jgi:hypothetical protein
MTDSIDLSPFERSCDGYLHWPLPCPEDHEIAEIIDPLVLDPTVLTNASQANVLSAFAARMAMLAVRRQSHEFIVKGLLASTLALSGHSDFRDVISDLALLYRAAELIGERPKELFVSTADRLPPELAEWLISFAGRTPEDRSLQAFGYVEKYDKDGFRFERTW